MSVLGADRQNHLVNMITENFLKNKMISAPDRDFLFQRIRIALSEFVREWTELDSKVEKKIRSIKRGVLPGTSEWELLYSKYFEEDFKKISSVLVKAQISGAPQNKKS